MCSVVFTRVFTAEVYSILQHFELLLSVLCTYIFSATSKCVVYSCI